MSDGISYHLIRSGDENGLDNVVALFPGRKKPIQQADSKHPHWKAIVEGLGNNDESVYDLFDVQTGVVTRLTSLSDRISFDGHEILFDGDPQVGPLADHLVRCLQAGVQDYAPLVKFWEKVAQNPDDRSREQLFTWLQSHEFTITEDGDILGYKGVAVDNAGNYTSINRSGVAWVDGVQKSGAIPNPIGAVITMPRAEVKNDPNAACHKGLHVGDWSYASDFAQGAVLEVHVNPRDVVSIPKDHSYRKMRCCKYKVVKVRTVKSDAPIHFTKDDTFVADVGYDPYE
jgi:hypothetical protein